MTDVLVVDDDADIAQLVRMILEMEGYSVASACHGRDALDWLASAPARPRAMLVDLSMPEMDGPTLIAHLAQTPDLCAIPVIVMTAERQPASRLKGLPVASLLPKPFHLDTLLSHVEQALDRGAAQAA